jgi:hypothetical protein
MSSIPHRSVRCLAVLGAAVAVALALLGPALPGHADTSTTSGAVYATNSTATIVNGNTNYGLPTDVYISGGPQNTTSAGLPDDDEDQEHAIPGPRSVAM